MQNDTFATKGLTAGHRYPWPTGMQIEPACAGHSEPELWFPISDYELERATEVCAACPIQALCAEIGLVREEYGVWGGNLLENGRVLPGIPKPGRPPKQRVA